MRTKHIMKTAGTCMATFCATFFVAGCELDPMNFLSRNACEFVNCDELFFIEDMFPLSARPQGDANSGDGMVMDMDEPDDDGGGHVH